MLEQRNPLAVEGKRGSLYYIRLNTQLGKFYKIGFTSFKSVHERLAYQGTGDEKLIEEVLYFEPHHNAFELEQCLHTYFGSKAAFSTYSASPDMPLARNGQSELYFEDVLGLDTKYSPAQADQARKMVELAVAKRTYTSEVWAKRMLAVNNIAFSALIGVAKLIGWSIRRIQRFLGVDLSEPPLPPSVLSMHSTAKKFLFELKEDQEKKQLRTLKELKLIGLISSFSFSDLDSFKQVVEIPELARDIANSMTADLIMLSCYMEVAHCCNMFGMLEKMNHENCHELIVRPIIESYIPVIGEFISSRKVTNLEINIPDDPIYAIDLELGKHQTFTEFFGPQEYLGLLNCRFVSRNPFRHDESKNTVEFSIELEDALTAKRFEIEIVVNFSTPKLRFKFPNLTSVKYDYQRQCRTHAAPV
ncbi:GIY-YIG nuclease family protein [Pseudomonas sp. PDM26]|uniref:GIY-YIG nuclease family protein n=1 Tax=Pseudomonas sp. PDM26 TaxID=2854766 RepID=UPI001C466765|nr:GIY-YIG nuclease family protein [Pseudomonas sp. PDM26]MBV7549874.1 GIY-YIG nuclease family protein [Pseudomonas sp. PDM26]